MSYTLEAIIVPVRPPDAATEIAKASISFGIFPFDDGSTILVRPHRPTFDNMVADFAQTMSSHLGDALLVRWDDQIGVKESRVYKDGTQTYLFTVEDEIYVKLDDDGTSLVDEKKYTYQEHIEGLDNGEEFDVYQNALELGCQQSGLCTWESLYDFMLRHGRNDVQPYTL